MENRNMILIIRLYKKRQMYVMIVRDFVNNLDTFYRGY